MADRQQLEAGWYWWDFAQAMDGDAWVAFTQANRGVLFTRKTWQGHDRTAVLFELRQPLRWTLGGLPTKAPRGINTELQDMATAPSPSPGFVVMVEELTGKSFDVFRRTGKAISDTASSTTSALKVLVWGGAAILLFNLFQNTKAEEPA